MHTYNVVHNLIYVRGPGRPSSSKAPKPCSSFQDVLQAEALAWRPHDPPQSFSAFSPCNGRIHLA